MNVEDEVDVLLSAKDPDAKRTVRKRHIKKSTWVYIGACIVCLSFGAIVVLPILNGKSVLEHIQSYLVSNENKNPFLADESNDSAAYHYWYAPENSFGIQEMKEVNWSYFWQLFRQHSAWQLEAWHPVLEEWVSEWQGENLNNWLNITRTRNETTNASEKITLNVTNNHPTQDLFFRFTFGIDLRVKEYINHSNWYEYVLTYPANETENYTVFFNFSDVKPLIQNGTVIARHGVHEYQGKDVYFFRLTQNMSRQPLQHGHWFEIDPTFGSEVDEALTSIIYNGVARRKASYFSPSSDGTADNISFLFYRTKSFEGGDEAVIYCGLYEYIDYDTDYAGELLGYTETVTLTSTDISKRWITLDFIGDPPPVSNGINYYIAIAVYSENLATTEDVEVRTAMSGNQISEIELGLEDPWVGDGSPLTRYLSIYCSYSEGGEPPPVNTAPTQSAQCIWDGTTNKTMNTTCITIPPTSFNVTLNDAEGDAMNITMRTNASGVWQDVNYSGNLGNGTYSNFTNTSWVDSWNTKYWISYNLTAMGNWTNRTFYFTTRLEPTVWLRTYANSSVDVPLTPKIWVQINTSCGYNSDVYFSENSTGSWVQRQSNKTVTSNTSVNWTFAQATTGSTQYWYMINRSQAGVASPNATNWYTFTTAANKTWQQSWTSNMSFSNNTYTLAQQWTSNFSFSNSTYDLQQQWTSNMSFSNSTYELTQQWTSNFSFSNTSNLNQQWTSNMSFSNTTYNLMQQWNSNMSFSNSTYSIVQQWTSNMSFSNSTFSLIQQWTSNMSFSNTTYNLEQQWTSNMSFSNTSNLNQQWTSNFSFSNSTYALEQQWTSNFSFSNTTYNLTQQWTSNFSFSNTSDLIQQWTSNFSFSNSTYALEQQWTSNFSFSNTTYDLTQQWTSNFSFSNTSNLTQQWTSNFSFSNSTVRTWQQSWTSNFSFSNSSVPPTVNITITEEYPDNETTIFSIQPIVYFTLTSTPGLTMNYTIYIGNSTANCTTILATGINVTNDTYFYEYYSATNYTSYYWRVWANDGITNINETYYFNQSLSGGAGGRSSIGIAVLALMFSSFGFVTFMLLMQKRRKK